MFRHLKRAQDEGLLMDAAIREPSKSGHKSSTWQSTCEIFTSNKQLYSLGFITYKDQEKPRLKEPFMVFYIVINHSLAVFLFLQCARKRQ